MKSIADKARENAVHFEGVKISMTQNKDGYMLKIAIHPDEVPESLMRDLVGARYMVAMCKLDDQNEPVEPPDKREKDRLFVSAVSLCRLPEFWKYLEDNGHSFSVTSEDDAAEAMRTALHIQSRKEIKEDQAVRRRWEAMLDDYRRSRE